MKDDVNGHDQTNYPDDKVPVNAKGSKVAPAPNSKPGDPVIEEEEDILKTEEDDAKFLRRLGTEPYIRFADFAKYLSLFNSRTGLDEKIQCIVFPIITVFYSLLPYLRRGWE